MKFIATKAVSFRDPGKGVRAKKIVLKEGDSFEVENAIGVVLMNGGQARRLGLKLASDADQKILDDSKPKATVGAASMADLAPYKERMEAMERELIELRENVTKGGGAAAQREIERLQALLKSSEQERAQLSEKVASFESRLASLEADQKPKPTKPTKSPKADSLESPEG